jgi:carbonic anhydrase
LKSAAPILNAAVTGAKLRIVGAVYQLSDGHVDIVA